MRLADTKTIHALVVYSMPTVVAWLGFGVPAAIGVTVLVAAAGVGVRLRELVTPGDPRLIELHTITYSHFVEKVRWCLDRTGLAYREVPSIGILGLLLTGRTVPLLVLPASRTSVGDSPKILRFLWGAYAAELPRERVGFLEPSTEAVALEKRFDEVLGINVRVWSYWHLLESTELTLLMWGAHEPTIPQWQRTVLPWLHPLLAAMLRRMLGVNETRAAAGLAATRQVFAEVDAMLADGRRYLMGGDAVTFVDITFASLAALVVFPDGYGGDRVTMHSAPLDRLSPVWRGEVEALRATAAGQFVLRLYREERECR